MYKLSATTLNLFLECPRCFWLQFNKGIKRPAGIFPSLPSGMDMILKKHFDRFIKSDKLPPELSGLKVKLFDDIKKLEIWRNNRKGIVYEDSDGNILKGAVDNILVKGKKLIVLDYKTRGYPLKEDTHEHYINQLNVYNFLLRKNGYDTEEYSYLLFYYPREVNKNGDVVFETKLLKIKTDIKKAERLFKNALACLNGKIPKCSEDCEYCRYVKSSK